MNCPNCESPKLKTIETFQTADMTYRTKICPACKWKFTSHEVIATEDKIPNQVRLGRPDAKLRNRARRSMTK